MKNILIILLFIPSLVNADKLILGGFSKHLGYPVPLNESHPAIGIEKNNTEYVFYHNSLNRTSFAITKLNRKPITDNVSYGFRVGIATGYNDFTTTGYDGKSYSMRGMPLGLMPQAQFLLSHQSKYITTDLGISVISTLTFKLNL